VQRMGQLIEDLLKLSRIKRAGLTLAETDLSELCGRILGGLAAADPHRRVAVTVQPGLTALADGRLLQVLAENLLGNAWKFTSRIPEARIEVGGIALPDGKAFFIRDNGAGFDMSYGHKMFQPFQRLHRVEEFEGTGIGLAIVQRIVQRHGGRVWAEGEPGKGACFFFSLAAQD